MANLTLTKTPDEVAERMALVHDKRVFLNGGPATVSGFRNRFATVTCRATGLSAEWSWPSVALVVLSRGGHFKS